MIDCFLGNDSECAYGTDNPSVIRKAGNAIQPPIDIIDNLGCSLFGQSCEETDDCCSPFVCVGKSCPKCYFVENLALHRIVELLM